MSCQQASETCLYLLSTRITTGHHQAWLLMWVLGLKLSLSCVHEVDFPDCSISLDVDGTKFLCSQRAVGKAELLNTQRGFYLFVLRKLEMDIFNSLVILAPCRARLSLNSPRLSCLSQTGHTGTFLCPLPASVFSLPQDLSASSRHRQGEVYNLVI